MATDLDRRAERWRITTEAKTSILLKTMRYKIFFLFVRQFATIRGESMNCKKLFGKVLNLSKTGSLMNLTINSNVMGAHTATEFRVTLSSWAGGPNLVNLQST